MAIDWKGKGFLDPKKMAEQVAHKVNYNLDKQGELKYNKNSYRKLIKYAKELPMLQKQQHEVFGINWEKGHGYQAEMLKFLQEKSLGGYIKTGIEQMVETEDGRQFTVNVTTDAVALLTAKKLSEESGKPMLEILETWAEYGSATIPEELEKYASPIVEDLALALTAAKYPVGELYRTFWELTTIPYISEEVATVYILEETDSVIDIVDYNTNGEYLTPKFKDYEAYVAAGGRRNDNTNWMYHAGYMDWQDELSLNSIDLDKASRHTELVDWLIKYALAHPSECVPANNLPTWVQERYEGLSNDIKD